MFCPFLAYPKEFPFLSSCLSSGEAGQFVVVQLLYRELGFFRKKDVHKNKVDVWVLLKFSSILLDTDFILTIFRLGKTQFAQLHNFCPNMNLNLLQITIVASPGMS
jgi:hypothetical protein